MILEYAQKVIAGGELTREEANELINVFDDDTMLLLAMADKIRQKFNGSDVDCCAIINARSGHCPENCKFCAQSAYSKTGVDVYGLLEEEELVAAAKKAKAAGAVRFSIVTSGRGQSEDKDFQNICKALTRIKKEVKIEVCASLGLLTNEQAVELKKAGITRFHSNIETAPSHFPDICSTHTYEDKMSTLEAAKAAGIRICSGGILGLNETPEQRVEMAMELKRLGVDSVPLNILNPVKGTPFEHNKPLTAWEILRAFAVFRFILPHALIRTAGGREVNLRDLQALALSGGLNGIMIGGYLTTGGRNPKADKVMLQDLGRTTTKPQL
ncbi:MAG: biotin synthase BioB [Acidaminococcaceae bacterium]|nr:biotin synthase BioB [Acidaminococcaceae bacterium]